jgi:hypothetical protein
LAALEVDHQLVLGRSLHWQIGRLFSSEDAINVTGHSSKLIDVIWPVGDQATIDDEKRKG